MKSSFLVRGVSVLFLGMAMSAHHAFADDYTVSLYQLEHKPCKEAKRLFEKAAKQLKEREYGPGLDTLQEAITIDPQYWDVENDIGFANLHQGKYLAARDAFQRAIDIDPENAVAYVNMGVAAFALHDYKLAEQCGHRALRLQPMMVRAKALMAFLSIQQGTWTPAAHSLMEDASSYAPIFNQILKLWPNPGTRPPTVILLSGAGHLTLE